MNLVESYATSILTDGGRLRSISGNSAQTPATNDNGLPVGVACTPMKTACCPFIDTLEVQLCAARSTSAMSSIRTSAPSFDLTTIFLNCATLASPVSAETLATVKKPLAWPGADW